MTTRQRRRRLDRRGRPRKAKARRRETTVNGRAAPDDTGTPELRRRKIRATTRPDVEITGAGVLLGRDLIDLEQFNVLTQITLWLSHLQHNWGGTGGCHALWLTILGAAVPTGFVRPHNATASGLADSARRQLARAVKRLDGSRDLVISLAEDRVPDVVFHVLEDRLTRSDKAELARLRDGLDDLAGRRRRA